MKVADIFCGPGGLSEGMRLGGMEVVYGFDKAADAIATFSYNHPLAEAVKGDALELNLDSIPEFDVLVGGPPCVNFSQSKGGRANILEGLELVHVFLRLVYERKPKYWVMENVPRIALHLPDTIPLRWIGIDKPGELEIPRRKEFNCADYGAPQIESDILSVVTLSPRPPTHPLLKNRIYLILHFTAGFGGATSLRFCKALAVHTENQRVVMWLIRPTVSKSLEDTLPTTTMKLTSLRMKRGELETAKRITRTWDSCLSRTRRIDLRERWSQRNLDERLLYLRRRRTVFVELRFESAQPFKPFRSTTIS